MKISAKKKAICEKITIFRLLNYLSNQVLILFRLQKGHIQRPIRNESDKLCIFFFLGRSDPGVESDTSDSRDGPNSPFTVLKKADVELLVGGKKKVYSVVIKVLPTDDMERHTSRRKFSDLLKFSKEVQVYCQALRCMVR